MLLAYIQRRSRRKLWMFIKKINRASKIDDPFPLFRIEIHPSHQMLVRRAIPISATKRSVLIDRVVLGQYCY